MQPEMNDGEGGSRPMRSKTRTTRPMRSRRRSRGRIDADVRSVA